MWRCSALSLVVRPLMMYSSMGLSIADAMVVC